MRSAISRNFPQFRIFPEFFRNCFLLVHVACLLVPCVSPVQRFCILLEASGGSVTALQLFRNVPATVLQLDFCFPRLQVMGQHFLKEFIGADSRQQVGDMLSRVLQGEDVSDFEFPLGTKAGEKLDMLLHATCRIRCDGSPAGVLGVAHDITRRKAAQELSETVASDLTRLLDTANAPIFGVDKDGLVNEWNMKSAEITGFSKEEVMGRDLIQEIMQSEYKDSVQVVLNNALQGQNTANFEFPLFTKDGNTVQVLLNATPRIDSMGKLVGVVGVGQDITEKKQAETELTRVADDLRALIDTANAPIFGIDTKGNVNEWNQKAAEITGRSKEEVMGRDLVAKFIEPEFRDSVKTVLDNALNGIVTANFEFPLYTKKGHRVEVLLNATTRRDAHGNVSGVVGVGQDITERKVAEKQSETIANDLTKLIDTANAPIFGIDTNGLVNEWNQKAAEITGFSKDEVMGRDLVKEFISAEFKTSVSMVLNNALTGQNTANFEFPLYTKKGTRVEVLLNATPRIDSMGKLVGVVGVGQDITEKKQAETELTRVADDLRALIDTANAPIFGIDTKGNVNEWNQKAAEITGRSKEEVMGHDLVAEFIEPEFRDSVKTVLDNALNGVVTANFEFPLYTKKGHRVEVLLNATTRRDAHGNVSGVVGVGQDITERKVAEKQSETIANDLTKLIDTANAPIFGIDTNGLVNEWNQKAAEITGFSKEEVMGRDLVQEFISADFKTSVQRVLNNALQGHNTANFEFTLYTKDHHAAEVLLNATPRIDSNGKLVGVVGVGQDITEKKQAEVELTRVADDLRKLIDTANAPIFGIDPQGRVNEWNQKAAEITGRGNDEVMGHDLVAEFIEPEFRDSVKAVLDNALNGIETANFEFPLYTKKGTRVDVLLNATTRRDASGNVSGVVGVGQDITERKAAEKESETVANDLTKLIDTANAPIFGIDTNGLVNEWNQKAAEITGFGKDEVMGRDLVKEFISAEFKDSVSMVLNGALKGENTANFEFPLYTKDGRAVEVLLNATPRIDSVGKLVGVVGVGQDITEKKQAEIQLVLVADDLRKLIDTANAPIFGIDPLGRVNEWNQKAAEITGRPKEEVMGHDLVAEFISPDYRDSVKAVLDNALNGIETANFEFPLYTKKGYRVEVLLNATTRRDMNGNVSGVVGVGQDITERKAAEKESETVANDLTKLIDTANAPIFGIDTNGFVNEWNQKAAEITGFSKDEVMGRDLVQEFISADFKTSVSMVLNNALTGQNTANFEFPLYTKDRRAVEVLLNATPRIDSKGKLVGVVGVGQDITDKKQAEAELTRVADDLRALIDTANAPIFGIDTKGNVNEWNQKAAEITGRSKEEVMGHDLVAEFIEPEFRDSVKTVLDNALNGIVTANFEFPLYTKQGTRVDVLLNATTRRDGNGNVSGVVGVGQDITERKVAEKQSETIANDLTKLIDTANAPIFGIDTNGLVNEWNQKAAEITGFSKEEVMGRDLVQEFISADFKTSVSMVLNNALTGQNTANFEFPLYTKDRRAVEVLLNATPRIDSNGKLVGVVGVGQDITDKKQAEAELTRVADDLRALIDTANAPIFGIDTKGNVNEWNQKAAEITGRSKEEVMGHDLVAEFIEPEFRDSVKTVLDNALNGIVTANFEFPLYTKKGTRVDVLLNATTRRDGNGNVSGVVGVGQDITERKVAEKQSETIANDLTKLIDTANAPIFGIDTNGLVNEWNQKAAEITGFSKEEVMGRDLVQEFISADFKTSVSMVLNNALTGQNTANFEFPLYTKDRRAVEVLLNATPRIDSNGKLVGVVGVGQDITDNKQAEAELTRVADDLRALIDTANAPIFGIDTKGNVNEWNQKAAEITGRSKEEVMGRDLVAEFIEPEFRDSVKTVLDNALNGIVTANFEFPLYTKKGTRVDVLLNATTRRDGNGNVSGVVGVGQDITERKVAEKQSETIANDLTKLIDTANAPIFGIDTNGLVNEWNQKAAEITGFSKEEVMGRDLVQEFISADFKTSVSMVLNNALTGQNTANFEFPLYTKDRRAVEVLLNATPRIDSMGKLVGVVGVGQDITDKKQAEAELTRVADDLRALIDTANAPIFGIDTKGNVNEWNQKAAEITGRSKEEVMGRDLVAEFIEPEFRDSVKAVLDNALDGIEAANFEFPLYTKKGHRVEVLLNATTRRDAHGNVSGVVGVGQDITERKAAEKESETVANDLTKLIDTANAPIFGIDTNGFVNEWNQKAAEITGFGKDEVMGRDLVKEFISADFKTSVQVVLNNALTGQNTANFEFPLYTKDRRAVEVLLNATPRIDSKGNLVGVVGVGQDITDKKQAEAELTRVADDLRALIDTANAPIFGIDTKGNVNEWNQKAAEITGRSKEEVMGRDLVAEFIEPEFRDSVKTVLDNALNGIVTANFEFPLYTKKGTRVDVLLNATTRRDGNGNVSGVVGVGQDITERKVAEKQSETIANDLTKLIDTANAPIFGIDTNGLVNEWNQKAAEITGFSKEEVMGRDLVQEFISADFKTSVSMVLNNALTGQNTANFEFPLYTKDRRAVEVLLNATPRIDSNGKLVGVVGVGQDITDKKQAEAELTRVADDLRALIDTANAPIFGIDTKGNVNEWNQKAAEITGRSKEEVMGRDLVAEFIEPEFRDSVKTVLDNALNGIVTANFEFPLYTKKGTRVDVLLNATTRRDGNGNVSGVVGVGQDITERKVAEKQSETIANDLTKLIDTANAPIFGIDTNGLVNEWNQKAAEITGFSKEEVMGRDLVQEFISADFKTSVSMVLNNALTGQNTANFEFPLYTKDRRAVEVLLNATPRIDSMGKLVGVVGVGQDITDKKQAEAELTRVADDLRALIDTANAPIFGIDTKGNVNEWNQKAAEITGRSKEEVMGRDLVAEFIEPEFRDSVKAVLDNALDGIEAANFEFPLYTKKGHRVEVLLNATTRRDAHGNVSGVVGVGQDITERKAAEKESETVANDLTKLIDTANAPIFGIDTNGFVNEWNQKAAEITGFGKDEVMGRDLVKEFISADFKTSVQVVLNNALTGQNTANFEFPLYTKDRRAVEVLLNATPRIDSKGNLVGVVGVGQDITDKKQAEAELTRVADDLRALIDTANAPIFGIDTKGNVNEWNQKAAEITGRSKEEVMGRDLVAEFIEPEFRDSVKTVLDNALNGIVTANFEFPLYTKKGTRVDVLLNATTRRDGNGNVSGVVGVGQDITERKVAEKQSETIANDLTKLIDTANAPIFGIDTNGLVNEWNQKAAEITGFSKEEVMGRDLVQEFISADFKTSVSMVLNNALTGQNTANFEFPLYTKDRRAVEVLLNATPRIDSMGKLVGVVGVGQDITDKKQAEAELTRVADDLRALIDTANAPIFGIDTKGNVNEWNQKAAEITGRSKEEVMGHDLVAEFIEPEFRDSVKAVLDNALDGIEAANFEFPLYTKKGHRVEVLLNATTRRDAHGNVSGVVGVGQDITERKAAEKESETVANDLTKLIDTANAPIFGIDTNGFVNEWNQKAAEITGFGKDEVMGRDLVQEFISAEFKTSVSMVLNNALTGQNTANFEFPLYTKDRRAVEVLLNATPRIDSKGNLVGVVGVGQDITDKKQAEAELTRVADDLRALIDTANAPIFGIDTKGNVNEWNQKAAEITGRSKEEVMGRDLVAEFIEPEFRDSVKTVLDNALNGIVTANFEFPLYTKQGTRVDVLLNATTRRDGNGNVSGVVGVGQDITERKVAEKQSETIANDLTKLIDTANAPIFGIDTNGLVNEWNQKAAEITGFSKEEVMGRDLVQEFISADFKTSVSMVLNNALTGQNTANFEFTLYTKDHHAAEVLLNATPRIDSNGKLVGVVGVGQDITEKKQAEVELTRVADDLRKLIDTANAPIFGIDPQGRVNEWNQKAAEITGRGNDEVMGHDLVAEFIEPEFRDSVKAVLDNALNGIETANFEFPLYTKKGTRVDVLLNATTRRDASGNVSGVVGVGQDITERKVAEKESETVANDLTKLIDTANAPIFGIDTNGLVNEWNQKAAEITGFGKDEVMGRDLVKEFISAEFKDSVSMVLNGALKGENTANFEFPLYTKDGRAVEVLLNATPRIDSVGKLVGVVGVGQDITEKKQAETELTRVADDLRALIDTANAPIFGIDTKGNVNEWNQKAAEITGRSKEEVMGRDLVAKFIEPEFRDSVKTVLDNALNGIVTANFEFPLYTKKGHRVEVLLNATTRRDAHGNVSGVVGVGQDITERKVAEKQSETIANDLTKLIDTANAPIFGIDTNGLVNEWNQKAAEITGFSKDEVMGRDLVKEFISAEFKTSVSMVLNNALTGQNTANFEFPLYTKKGTRVEVLLNATPRIDSMGKLVGVVGVGQDITEKKQAETELTRVADDLRALIDTANAPIFGIDTKGNVNEWNQKAAEITGRSKEEVMGHDLVAEFIEPEFRDSVKTVLDNALNGVVTANFEFPLYTKKGHRVEVLLNATTRRDAHGNVSGVVGVGQDITERKVAEKQSETIANDLTKLIDTANAPIFGIDTNGLVNEWNQKAAEITGFSKEEVMGRDLVQEFISADFKTSVQRVLNNALQGHNTANFEFTLYTKDHHAAEVLLNATPRIDSNGKLVGVVGVGQDITEKKQAEVELTRVADDLRKLIDTANAPIFGIDPQGRVNEWNQKAAEITGRGNDEVMGHDLVAEFIEPEFRDSVKAVLDNALNGIETANFEFPLYTKKGTRVDVLLNATTRRDASGNVSGVVGVGQDITERKAAEKESETVANDLTKLIDTANAPIFGIDTNGLVNEWNQKAAEITGFGKDEVMGRDLVKEFISAEFKDSVSMVLNGALKGENTANFEFPLYTKDGRAVEVLLNATPRIDSVGKLVGVVGVGQDITEKKQAEIQLVLVADDLRKLIDTANAPIFGIDPLGRVNEWNQKAAEITGRPKEEVMGHDLVAEFISPDYRDSVKAVLDNALNGIETANFEFPLYTKKGYRVEVLLNATTRRDMNGNVSGVVGVGQDITERKAAEKESETVANDLTKLIDTANAPIFGIDTNGFVNEWNQKAAEITGFGKDEVMGRDLVQEFISADFKTSVQMVLNNALTGQNTANFEFPLYTKDRRAVEVLLNATPRIDSKGNLVGVVGVGQDITEKKQAEAELTRVADDLRALIDTANAPIFGIDTKGNVNEWNQKAAEITGRSKEEVMGHDLVAEFIEPEFRDSVKTVLDNALNGIVTANFEFPLYTKQGTRVDVLLNATTRRDGNGNVSGVVGVGQDITERKVAEKQSETIANDLTKLIDTANAPIFGIDTNGLVNEWNQKAAEITGFSKEEVMGRDLVQEFISADFRTSVQVVLNNALQGHNTANFEFPLYTQKGTRVEVLLNATPRIDSMGKLVGVVGVGQDITEKKQAETELTRVADDLRALIDTANAPIFGIDTKGNVNEWNQKAAEITGRSKEEVMGHDLVAEFIEPEFRASVKAVLDNALNGIVTANFEFPLYTKEGKRVEVLLNATTRRDAQGNVSGVVGVGQDITERKVAEKQSETIANDLTKLIDTANAPIFGIDTNGLVNEWNQKAAEITGFSKEEVMGRDLVQEFISAEFRISVQVVLNNALQGHNTANFEFPLYTKDRRAVEVLLNATPRIDSNGKLVGVVGVGQDITEKKQAETELTRVADDLRALIDTANAPIFGIDTKGNVNEWNQKAAEITGRSKEEVMGHDLVAEFIEPEFRDSVKTVLDNALNGIVTANFEFPLYTKQGTRVDVLLNATTRRDGNGNVSGVVGVGQDITERKVAEKQSETIANDLTKLIDTANAPIFGIDTNGLVNEWNQKAAEITGFSKEEVMGRDLVQEFISADFRTSVQVVLNNALQGHNTANFEFPLYTQKGTRVEVLLNATPRIDSMGKLVGVVGVGQDITDKKQAETELTRVADDLRALIDTANAPIFGIDTKGNVNEWNQKAAEITGRSKEEVMGHDLVAEFIEPEFRDSVKTVLDNALNGIVTANFEFPLYTKEGKRVEVLLNATTRRDAQGNVSGVVGVGQDITERKVAEKQSETIANDLTKLIDTANAPIFGIDTNGFVNEWNQKAAEITGFSKEEVMGRDLVQEFISAEFRISVQVVLNNALQGHNTANFEFPLYTKDRRAVEVLLNATPRIDSNGKLVGVVGVGQDITDKKQAENELTRVADDLRALIDTANAPIFGIDTKGNVNEWNQKAAEITGRSKEEVMGHDLVAEFISPEFRDSVKAVLDNALNGIVTANFEFPLYTKQGKRVDVLLNATTRRDGNGNVSGVVGVGQDITERKVAEKQSETIANDLTKLIDTANAPIFGIDTNGLVNEWNQKAAEITGFSKDEVMGRDLVQEFISAEFKTSVQRVLNNALTGQNTANFEFPLYTKDRRAVEVLLNATPRIDSMGKLVGVVGVGQDITEKKQAQEELTRIADDLRNLIDTANAPIFGIDTKGNVNEWNQKAAEITGRSKEEVMGHDLVAEFISPEFRDSVKAVLDNALNGIVTANFEFPLYTKQGTRVDVLLNATTRRDAYGNVSGVVGVGQDITERKVAEKQSETIANDLTKLIDTANAPIFGIDIDGHINEWNQKAAEITGYTKEEVLGTDLVNGSPLTPVRVVLLTARCPVPLTPCSPFEAPGPPFKAPGPPFTASGPPFTGPGSPFNGLGSPFNAPGSPLNGLGSPFKAPGSPFKGLGSPFKAPGSPFKGLGSPFKAPGSPLNGLGSPFKAPGSPLDCLGPPFKAPGSPFKGLGSPFKAPGSPFKGLCSPFKAPGSPFKGLGSPFKAPGSPFKGLGSPFKAPGSPFKAPGSPLKAPGSPFKGLGSPFKGLGAPFKAPGSPFKGLCSPFKGLGSPFKGLGSPFKGLGSPFKAPGSPFKGLDPPFKGLGSPFKGLGSPFKGLGSPLNGLGSPFKAPGSTFKGLGSPFKAPGSPFKGLGSPFKGLGAPFKGLGSPFKGLGSPFKGLGSPLKAPGSPFKGLGSPFKGLGAPFKAPGSPFRGLCSPFKGLGSPFKGLGSPFKGLGSPFKAPGSPFKGLGSPFKAPGSPFKGLGSPFNAPGSPFKGLGSRFKAPGSPFKGLGSPFKAPGSPFNGLGSPFKAPGSPFKGLGSPFKAPGSPLKAPGSPLNGLGPPLKAPGSPFKGLGSPFKAPGSPLDCLGPPLKAPGSPLNGLGSPLSGLGSPLKAPGSPFKGLGPPLKAPGSPFRGLGSPFKALGSPLKAPGSPLNGLGSPFKAPGSPLDCLGLTI